MNEYLKITAAANSDSKPKVEGCAYGGGKMNLPGWDRPVVVDLEGLSISQNTPLLTNHENKTTSRIGVVNAEIQDNKLLIDGSITSSSETAEGIVEQGKAGSDWQLSIGAEAKAVEFVKSGTRSINAQDHEGPFYHVRESLLREVSVVAVGADGSTSMRVKAMFDLGGDKEALLANAQGNLIQGQGEDMDKDKKNKTKETDPVKVQAAASAPVSDNPNTDVKAAAEAVNQERMRVSAIINLCAGEYKDIESEAIEAGWTVEATSKRVLESIRADRPQSDVHVMVRSEASGSQRKSALEAALCLRAGISDEQLTKDYGEQVIDMADKIRAMALPDIFRQCIKLEGMSVPEGSDTALIQAAFSTVSLPGLLSNVANKRMLKAFKSQPLIAPKLCSVGDLNDFKESERFRLTDVGDLSKIPADGEIKNGSVREDKATNRLETYGKKFVLTRQMIINDDLGAFIKFPTSMGNRAARLIDQLFFQRLLINPAQADDKALFHIAHKNLLTGAGSKLSNDALSKAITKFLDQTDSDGQPISVEPRFLLVPTNLKHEAIALTRGSQLIISGGDATEGAAPSLVPALNALADENLSVLSSAYLSNSNYTGNSTTAWYLFGSPSEVDTFEIGYLKGRRTPIIEKGNTDFNTLGMWFRVYFDLGIREQDHRGVVKSNGA
ncbi:MAG: hypothetical protein ACIAQZ_12310 [Sedimentisphaeraceae bacterium JB056]